MHGLCSEKETGRKHHWHFHQWCKWGMGLKVQWLLQQLMLHHKMWLLKNRWKCGFSSINHDFLHFVYFYLNIEELNNVYKCMITCTVSPLLVYVIIIGGRTPQPAFLVNACTLIVQHIFVYEWELAGGTIGIATRCECFTWSAWSIAHCVWNWGICK